MSALRVVEFGRANAMPSSHDDEDSARIERRSGADRREQFGIPWSKEFIITLLTIAVAGVANYYALKTQVANGDVKADEVRGSVTEIKNNTEAIRAAVDRLGNQVTEQKVRTEFLKQEIEQERQERQQQASDMKVLIDNLSNRLQASQARAK